MADRFLDPDRYFYEKDKELAMLPVCCNCGEPIQDDYLFDFDEYLLCEDCLKELYRRPADRYIEERYR